MITEPLTVSPKTVVRVLDEMCDSVARDERPPTSYSAIAGKDGTVSVEHAYVAPAGGDVPARLETTIYVPEPRLEDATSLIAEGDDAGGEPTRLADLGAPGTGLIETLEAIAAATTHLSGYSPDGDGFDPVCTDVYPETSGSEASVAFRGYLEIDDRIATRRSSSSQSTV